MLYVKRQNAKLLCYIQDNYRILKVMIIHCELPASRHKGIGGSELFFHLILTTRKLDKV